MKYLITFKNSIFGLVSIIWGSFFLLSDELLREPLLDLLVTTMPYDYLGFLFISIGLFHIYARINGRVPILVLSNILLAFAYLVVVLTHLYASFYTIAWIALFGIVLNQVVNAYLIVKGGG